MKTVKLGVLGAGRGAGLAQAVARVPGLALAALCDADENRLNRAAGEDVKRYTVYKAMLDDPDIDAVLVASPMPLHVAHSVAALKAGKHVLSEVTAATSIEQCWELLEAVRSSGRQYMLAENYCYTCFWSVVSGMVAAGLFGTLYYGEADQIQDFKAGVPPPETGYNWRTQELAMRQGHQYITHNLGPLYTAFRERIRQVVCLGSGQHHLAWAKADDTCVVLLETESGRLLRIRLDFFSTRPNNYLYLGLQGTGAAYEGPRAPGEGHKVYVHGQTPPGSWQSLWDYKQYLPPEWNALANDPEDDTHDGGLAVMLSDFARSVREGTRPPIDVVDALNLTAPGLLSEVSVRRGGAPVEVPKFG
ncbi:MAG: Gfo/Idh/MocA family oxidoreductase [Armatimonadetes bacterium]|nr:Gfo/Idh/MocA family oxidoreductase [Armatimonadota bacterium]